jgi:hypothetical protein
MNFFKSQLLKVVALVALRPMPSPSEASGDGIFPAPRNFTPQSACFAGRQSRSATLSTLNWLAYEN